MIEKVQKQKLDVFFFRASFICTIRQLLSYRIARPQWRGSFSGMAHLVVWLIQLYGSLSGMGHLVAWLIQWYGLFSCMAHLVVWSFSGMGHLVVWVIQLYDSFSGMGHLVVLIQWYRSFSGVAHLSHSGLGLRSHLSSTTQECFISLAMQLDFRPPQAGWHDR